MIKAVVFDAYGTLFDVQSVLAVTERAFPGRGALIGQIWRMKQLEYSWLRSLMDDYRDFWSVTREALAYTLAVLDLNPGDDLLDEIAAAYDTLEPYADAAPTLAALTGVRCAILSNGSPAMLAALVEGSPLKGLIEATLSVDAKRCFKPDPRAYQLVEEHLRVMPEEVMFVSSNGFDIAGAKRFGFHVARIARVAPTALATELEGGGAPSPLSLYQALRSHEEALGQRPDVVVSSLAELPGVVGSLAGPGL